MLLCKPSLQRNQISIAPGYVGVTAIGETCAGETGRMGQQGIRRQGAGRGTKVTKRVGTGKLLPQEGSSVISSVCSETDT